MRLLVTTEMRLSVEGLFTNGAWEFPFASVFKHDVRSQSGRETKPFTAFLAEMRFQMREMHGFHVNLESSGGGEFHGALGASVTPFRGIVHFAVLLQLRGSREAFAAVRADETFYLDLMDDFVVILQNLKFAKFFAAFRTRIRFEVLVDARNVLFEDPHRRENCLAHRTR